MALKEYNKKRDFTKTNEPKGKTTTSKNKALRFVIQYHQARAKHYDFRLEYNGVLLSWAVPKGLSLNPKDRRLAVHVEDHPVDYIDFEGIIPKGNYGAGSVEIYDKGFYLPSFDIEKGLKKGHLKFVLSGEKLKGEWSLVKIDEKNWLIIKSEDEFAVNKKSKQKTIKNPFDQCDAQLATLSKTIPTGNNWIFEIKYDGYRILSFVENGKVKMFTRNKLDYTKKFDSIAKSLKKIDQDAFVVDGEIVSFDETGKSNFGLLQQNIKDGKNNFHYVIFDLIALNGKDLRTLPLIERKKELEKILAKADDNLVYSTHIVGKGKESFALAKEKQLEGIMAKKIDSTYVGKRTDDWLKIKCYLRQEFVIIGYTTTEKNQLLSALLLGYYDDKKLKFIGKVGTGFDAVQRKNLNQKFKYIESKISPLKEDLNIKNVKWLKPTLVAEIQYAEITKDGLLRQPSFIGLRVDKNAKNVHLEVSNE
ncbi:MAG: non-homologous end-joining DNA ligase [Clostridia bacterium]|nr:non-homologous end-joining DNA ligase [Clostridia bacterium]